MKIYEEVGTHTFQWKIIMYLNILQGGHTFLAIKFPDFSLIFPWFDLIFPD